MGTTIDESTFTDAKSERAEMSRRRSPRAVARLSAFYLPLVLAGLMTVAFLPDLLATLVTGWTADGGAALGVHRLHVMGIAAVVSVFLLGLFAQAYRPTQRVASMWGAFLTILVVTAGTVGYGVGRPEEVIPFFLLTAIAFAAHPAGRALFRQGESYSPALLALIAVAAIPTFAFAATQFGLSASSIDSHAVSGHYVMMAGLILAPLAYGTFAALGFAGWRLAAWLAALPMAYYGLLAISFPIQSGAVGTIWAIGALCWAIAFVVTAEYSRVGKSSMLRRETRVD